MASDPNLPWNIRPVDSGNDPILSSLSAMTNTVSEDTATSWPELPKLRVPIPVSSSQKNVTSKAVSEPTNSEKQREYKKITDTSSYDLSQKYSFSKIKTTTSSLRSSLSEQTYKEESEYVKSLSERGSVIFTPSIEAFNLDQPKLAKMQDPEALQHSLCFYDVSVLYNGC
jgi:hypothetical protein